MQVQPDNLADALKGQGVTDTQEANKLVGIDPGSNFNSIDVKSQLATVDDVNSFFDGKTPAIEEPPKKNSSEKSQLVGGSIKLNDFQLIKENPDHTFTYIDNVKHEKIQFKTK